MLRSMLMWLSTLQVCHVRKKDIRKFLDGAYVEEKGQITQPPEE